MTKRLLIAGFAIGYVCCVAYLVQSDARWAKLGVASLAFVPGAMALFAASGLFGGIEPNVLASLRRYLARMGAVKSVVVLVLFWLHVLAIDHLQASQELWAALVLGALALTPGIVISVARWRAVDR